MLNCDDKGVGAEWLRCNSMVIVTVLVLRLGPYDRHRKYVDWWHDEFILCLFH